MNSSRACLDTLSVAIPQPLEKQGIICFGHNHHNLSVEDVDYRIKADAMMAAEQKQYEMLWNILEEAELSSQNAPENQKTFYIFVEQTRTIFPEADVVRQRIIEGLLYYSANRAFKRTMVVNGDARKLCNIAYQILMLEKLHFLQILGHQSEKKKHPVADCYVHLLTFEDLIKEFHTLYQQMSSFRDSWENTRIQQEFNADLGYALTFFRDLEKEIELIGPGRTILEFAESLHCKHAHEYRTNLAGLILHTFCRFLDLYVYQHILLLKGQPIEKILVFAGTGHIENLVYHHLCDEHHRVFSKVDKAINNTRSIDQEELDKIKKPFIQYVAEEFPDVMAPQRASCCSLL